MSNKNVFKSAPAGRKIPAAEHHNRAGGVAYQLSDEAALAQYAATGTFNDTFYSTGEMQVEEVLKLADNVSLEFIAKTAIYAREHGRMKDMPSLLFTLLMNRGAEGMALARRIFPVVVNNSRMLRNVFQMQRSGKLGRKSFATAPTKLLTTWFTSRRPDEIFRQSVGNDPTLGNIMEMIWLRGGDSPERTALYAYLKGKKHDFDSLPPFVKEYLTFKKDPSAWSGELPKVPFEMLMGLPLSEKQWSALAQQASWPQLRMNLNTFARHGVFKNEGIARTLAAKLRDPEAVKKAKPFPYQLMTTYLHTSESGAEAVPRIIRNALHDALDVSVGLVPSIEGPAHALIDVSGSMQDPVTGHRQGATSKARCIDVAAMVGSMLLRRNEESTIIAYSDYAITNHGCESRDSVMTNANRLAKLGGGGTNLGAAFDELNNRKAKGNLVLVASDMETWADRQVSASSWQSWSHSYGGASGTVSAQAWEQYKSRNPKAKLVCINLRAGDSCQIANNTDVLNLGGFSDTLWEVIASFVDRRPSADHWVDTIKAVNIPSP